MASSPIISMHDVVRLQFTEYLVVVKLYEMAFYISGLLSTNLSNLLTIGLSHNNIIGQPNIRNGSPSRMRGAAKEASPGYEILTSFSYYIL